MDSRPRSTESARPSELPELASALREISSLPTVDETLQRAVELATEVIPGCTVADVMFWRIGGTTTPVSSDPIAIALDEAQSAAGEGPCLLAALEQPIVVCDDLATDERFPSFGPRAVRMGMRSAVSHQLFLDRHDRDRLGALNLYGAAGHAFDDAAVQVSAVFAAHCAAALAAAITRDGLESALATRDVIGQAKGILMATHQISATEAFGLLRDYSQEHNVAVRDVAARVTATGALP